MTFIAGAQKISSLYHRIISLEKMKGASIAFDYMFYSLKGEDKTIF